MKLHPLTRSFAAASTVASLALGMTAAFGATHSPIAAAHAPVAAKRASTTQVAAAPLAPPPLPPKHPVTTNYFGTKITDDYRYFEAPGNPVAKSLFAAENTHTRAVLDKLGAPREALYRRIAALDASGATVRSVQVVGDRYFYLKRTPADNADKLYVKPIAGDAAERVLVDPQKLVTKPNQHFTIEYFTPSLDGEHVAYGVDEGGSENATLHVVETGTGRVLADSIDRAKYVGATGWRPDGTSFYYLRFPAHAAPAEVERRAKIYLHTLGSNPDTDPAVFGFGVDPKVPVAPDDFSVVLVSPKSDYALGVISHGVANEVTIYSAPLASVTSSSVPWKKVADVSDEVTSQDWVGNVAYLVSHKGASNYEVLAKNLDQPYITPARTVVAPSKAVVEQVAIAQDGLYVRARTGGFGSVTRTPLGADSLPFADPAPVTLPFDGTVGDLATDPRRDGATFGITSWVKPQLYFRSDATGAVVDTGLKALPAIDLDAYTSDETTAPSVDGTAIPLSIIHRKDLALDGTHPTYLNGYGSYGIEIEPGFSAGRVAWLEHGGVYAICHVRGGGWFGEDWHNAGKIATKQHTIDDFVACGKYLIAQKYTSAAHLGGEGTSAGGITIGRAITEHPELFGAALDVVGVSDALRSENTPNGPANIPEFGTAKDPEQFPALYNMDAYLHVKPGTAYPAVMLITGINDPRVSSWELLKMTAALQGATSARKPVMLRVDYDGGHGFLASSRAQADRLLTDEYAFMLWQLGDPAFASIPESLGAQPRTLK